MIRIGQAEEEPAPQHRLAGGGAPDPPSGPPESIILLLFVILTLAASAFVLLGEEREAADDPKAKAARGEVRGLGKLSLLREANLRKALAEVDAGDYPLVTNVRVAPDRINITAENEEGEQKILTIHPGGDVEEQDFGTSSGTGTVRAAKVDARGPERMLRAVAKRTELPLENVDYATISFSASGSIDPTWFLAVTKAPARDRQWIAEADGSDLRRSGEVAPSVQRENERRQRQLQAEAKRAERLFERRTKCLQAATSAPEITRCIERFAP